jgi:predicted aspartyl protease
MTRALVVLLLLLGVAGCATDPYGPNAAGICPLIRVAEMPLTIQRDVMFVDGTIDNQPVRLLVDSGAERTLLAEDAVKRLQLPRDTKHATRTIGIGGPSTSFDALLPHGVVLGGTELPVDRVTVGQFSIAHAGGDAGADGLLGADILLAFDVDLNLPAHRLTMYRARRECPNAEPPWSAQYLAISGITTHRDRLMLPFVLDGVNGVAILDTGAQLSSISGTMAAKLGVSDNGPSEDAMITAHGAAPQEVRVRLHRFNELRVGPAVVNEPLMPVVPMSFDMGDALIGGDFLRGRRVWLSFSTHRVLVTPLPGAPAVAMTQTEP